MLKRAAQLANILALCSVISFAQTGHAVSLSQRAETDAGSSTGAQENAASAVSLLTIVLRLNDSQQRDLRAAFDEALTTAAPISAKIQAHKSSLFEAVRSGKTEQIKELAAEQGKLTSEMLLLQAQTFAKLWGLLNADQKSQVDDFVYGNIRLVLPASPQ
ncbi:MAG TPA: hypothetical protein VFB23_02140 [Candidatus Acidoferrales bacterium]|jgi:hypothetical protein|nr:hypothetical protein [Candidatus Acidoferrales bacterium]